MTKPATLNDVAAAAGVSPITASRAINGGGNVAESTRQRILSASQDCGYVPRAAARAMKSGRHMRIACAVVRYGESNAAGWPNMHSYIEVGANQLAERGYSLVVEPLQIDVDTDTFQGMPRLFAELAVDGVMGISGAPVPRTIDDQLEMLRVPVVWCNRDDAEAAPCIYTEEQAGGRMLVDHLAALGHTRIAYLGTESGHFSANARRVGVREALRHHGLDEASVVTTARYQDAAAQLDRLLADRPTAVICYNRQFYNLCLFQLARRGLRVPDDLSLCCFASAWEDHEIEPATMAVLPENQMVSRSVHALLTMIAGKPAPARQQTYRPTLRVGQTTAPPSAAQ